LVDNKEINMSKKKNVLLNLARCGIFGVVWAINVLSLSAATVYVNVDFNKVIGEIKPVNGVGQPPMAGQLGRWSMMKYLKDAGVPYA
jgi:hypothetical protein